MNSWWKSESYFTTDISVPLNFQVKGILKALRLNWFPKPYSVNSTTCVFLIG
jgi:hypothetical protein